jgi:hypothetical protein
MLHATSGCITATSPMMCVCVCVVGFLRGSVAEGNYTGSRRTLLRDSIIHGRSQFKVHTDERTHSSMVLRQCWAAAAAAAATDS